MSLEEIRESAIAAIESAANPEALEEIRIHYLGRKGELTSLLRSLKEIPIEARRDVGSRANALQKELELLLSEKENIYGKTKDHGIDITAPGKRIQKGHLHPLTLVDRDIRKIFGGMGFTSLQGSEVETEYYNFDALNIPANHPARDMWDTFWIKQDKEQNSKKRYLLRTHTSPMQVRYMEKHTPPFRIIVPGRVFRYEATDMSHEVNFYQLEGLMVGKDVSLSNFKFVVESFFKKFFSKQKIEFRYRPSYFPFTEPSLEVDIKLGNKWLEVMGAGMVHPNVFEYAHYNPRDWQGFAFGVGIDRLAMIKYGVPDIRLFYSGDIRFIRQF